ncbi:MAG TPA: helix-turn-helix transcriptional regulator [Bacteroidia bacterium]|nr:helix-turn-helix transcriptional regulator [Bacteroidia bacterium]
MKDCTIVNRMDRDFNKIIASHIRSLRLQNGVSRKEMAEDLNCSYSAYCRLEAGEIELINPKLTQAANFFQVTINKLLFDVVKDKVGEEYPGLNIEYTIVADALKSKDELIAVLERQLASLNEQVRMKDLQIDRILCFSKLKSR